MKSSINERFLKAYRRLPSEVRRQARAAYRLFRDNPYHNSLNFKKIGSNRPIYSARVSRRYRVLGILEDDEITWFWIGSHTEYDKIISKR